MQPRPWQIWKVWFPFRENPSAGKYRPVVIKEVTEDNCVVIYITSQVEKRIFRTSCLSTIGMKQVSQKLQPSATEGC